MCVVTKEIPLQPALLKIDGVDTRREHKLTAGTPKNEHPCSFLGCQFAEANWLLLETTAIHGGNDTLRTVFSSGMDAACDNQKRCFGSAETRSQNYTRMYSFGADAPYIFKRPI